MKRFSILAIFLLILIGISITFCEASTNTSTNINVNGKDEFVDSPTTDLSQFFKERKRIYHIQYDHTTRDSIILPDSCILSFEGGSIAAPIVFNDTRLSGQIKLQGSSISGSISNSVFDASWLCYRDEKRDDANNINQIISVSDNIFFPDGDYYLESLAMPSKDVSTTLHSELKCHIGIHRSNVHLYGDKNTRFVSTTPIVMICAYSCPYQIDNSISNLQFQNIRFSEKNDKLNFHEFAHTLKLIGINNCTISDCVFDDFWGDAITLGHYGDNVKTGERTRNQNIKIYNNIIQVSQVD